MTRALETFKDTKQLLEYKVKQGHIKRCSDCNIFIGREYIICGPCEEKNKTYDELKKLK